MDDNHHTSMTSRVEVTGPGRTSSDSRPMRPRCFYSLFLDDQTLAGSVVRFIIRVPVMLSLTVLGLFGNVLSFIVLGKEMRKSSTSFLLRSLAIVDNTVLISYAFYFSFPAIYTSTSKLVDYFEFHQILNRYLWGVLWLCKTIGIYLIVFVTAERFIAVCRPLKAKSLCTVKNARISVGCLCIFSFAYNLPKIFIMEVVYVIDRCTGLPKPFTSISALYFNEYFIWIYTYGLWYVFIVVIPWGTILVLNAFLIKSLKGTSTGNLGTNQDKRQKETMSITVRVLAVSVVFIMLEMPQVIANIIYTVTIIAKSEAGIDMPLLYNVLGNSYFLSTINSFINFYIYCLTGKGFRLTLKRMFRFVHVEV